MQFVFSVGVYRYGQHIFRWLMKRVPIWKDTKTWGAVAEMIRCADKEERLHYSISTIHCIDWKLYETMAQRNDRSEKKSGGLHPVFSRRRNPAGQWEGGEFRLAGRKHPVLLLCCSCRVYFSRYFWTDTQRRDVFQHIVSRCGHVILRKQEVSSASLLFGCWRFVLTSG